MHFENKFYMNRPKSEEDREAILEFLEFERMCDEENAREFNIMDKSHLNKTKAKQAETAIRSWDKLSSRNIGHYNSIDLMSMNSNRKWYGSTN